MRSLALALIGVGGVTAAGVGERMPEFGIRVALGATPARVNRLVLRQAVVPILPGSAGRRGCRHAVGARRG